MKPTLKQLEMQLAGAQALLAYTQQERDAALQANTAAHERETATAGILRIINESPADLARIMPAIGRAAERLCEADHGVIGFEVKGVDGQPTFHNWDAIRGLRVFEEGVSRFALSAADEIRGYTHVVGRVENWQAEYPGLVSITRADGLAELALLSVPLMSGKSRIGFMVVRRSTARPFDPHHITLLQHLAAQAVVAVENARIFNELDARNREVAETLEQQTAMAEVLEVISRAPANLQSALDAVIVKACRLLDSENAVVIRSMPDGSTARVSAAVDGEITEHSRLDAPAPVPSDSSSGITTTVMRHGGPHAIRLDAPDLARLWEAGGVNSSIVTPLTTTAVPFGRLVVSRRSSAPYTPRQVRLFETFAAQAVIAIENAGLFNELQASNRDVSEALERQTATSDVLEVISRAPADLQPVLDKIAGLGARLLRAEHGFVLKRGPERMQVVALASQGTGRAVSLESPIEFPLIDAPGSAAGTAFRQQVTVHLHGGVDANAEAWPDTVAGWRTMNIGSAVNVPLSVKGEPWGVVMAARTSNEPFSAGQVALLETFAAQAAIAIENARLFNELKDSNAELAASVEREAALARISQRINEHPLDVDGTLVAIAEAARELTDGDSARVWFVEDKQLIAGPGAVGRGRDAYAAGGYPIGLAGPGPASRAVRERVGFAVDDLTATLRDWFREAPQADVSAYSPNPAAMLERLEATSVRSNMAAPLGRINPLGAIAVTRVDVRPFDAGELVTLEAFAAQAVVAIETARAQQQLVERNDALAKGLERETATADILRTISQSPGEIEGVLSAIAAAARRLCDADHVAIGFMRRDDAGEVRSVFWDPVRGLHVHDASERDFRQDQENLGTEVMQATGPIDSWPPNFAVHALRAREDSLTEAALLRINVSSAVGTHGMVIVRRNVAQEFSPEHVTLLRRFADQALIAIDNARVFNELQARNKEITEALRREEATGAILRHISNTPEDLDTTLTAISTAARELCDADGANVWLVEGDEAVGGSYSARVDFPSGPPGRSPLDAPFAHTRAIREGGTIVLDDVIAMLRARGITDLDPVFRSRIRTIMAAPIIREGSVLGSIGLVRTELRPFSQQEVALLESFADQAAIAIDNARLIRELRERNREVSDALERQTALADVLNVIASSATDAKPVLEAIIETGSRLCAADGASAHIIHGDLLRMEVARGYIASMVDDARTSWPVDDRSATGRAVQQRCTIVVNGQQELDQFSNSAALTVDYTINSLMAVPLLRGDRALGALAFLSAREEAFSAQQVALIETFADQAAIAIDNARLFNELQARNKEITEALRREEASSEILRQISESPEELDATLQAISDAARRLTSMTVGVSLLEGEFRVLRRASVTPDYSGGFPPLGKPLPLTERFRRAIRSRQPVLWSRTDLSEADAEQERWLAQDARAMAGVPIPRGSEVLGFLVVASAIDDVIAPAAITLLQSFADQAAIAIENARLIRELRESNQIVSENLDRQQVLGNVLSIIASAPADLDATLPEIAAAALRLCECNIAAVLHIEGGDARVWDTNRGYFTHPFDRQNPIATRAFPDVAIAENRLVEVVGAIDEWADDYPGAARINRIDGRTELSALTVPLPGRDGPVGAILAARDDATPFSDRHKTILQTLANQAVIAIANARLFNELQARNKEITEALRREEAGSEILRLISNSPEDLATTLQAIPSAARRLTGMTSGLLLVEGDQMIIRGLAVTPGDPVIGQIGQPSLINQSNEFRERLQNREPYVGNWQDQSDGSRDLTKRAGVRSVAGAPIWRGDVMLGVLTINNSTGESITQPMVSLLQTFADQAAIAIENARLIRELRESNQVVSENLDRQQVLSNVLSIIASAPSNLDATLPEIAAAAQRLCECDFAAVLYIEGVEARLWETSRGHFTHPFNRENLIATRSFPGVAIAENRLLEVVGPIDEWADQYPAAARVNRLDGRTELAALTVPLPGRDGPVGAILAGRDKATPFSDRHKDVLQTLANQAVIAIENARLFNELQTKTQELEIASRHKSEFLANMSHELRTPLNAIIGYAELLQEECEDLGHEDFLPDLGKIHTAGKHLLTLISGILDLSKVEAGRMTMFLEDFDVATLVREAESIVRPVVEKNRNAFVIDCPADIGALHADLVKVRQVLFNLLSNAAKFTEGGTITLTVRRHVEPSTYTFAIRDTGIGITDAQRVRLFEAFSQAEVHTSRKYGGTGLGLALSRQFCLMMGGDITVDSVPGEGSTFTATLPTVVVDAEAAPNSAPTRIQRN